MREAIDIVVGGHLCLDLIPRMEGVPLEKHLSPGQLFLVGALDISTGGAVSNTGLALHRLGAEVRLMATVGDDLIGHAVLDFLNDRDPHLANLISVTRGKATSYTVILSSEQLDRVFFHYPGTNRTFDPTHVDFSLLAQATIFHLGYPPLLPRLIAHEGHELENLYRQAKASGAVTSLDMSLPDRHGSGGRVDWRTIIERTLPYVDIFIPSIEEILFMLRRDDFDAWQGDPLPHLTVDYLVALADELLAMGAVIVGFKLGAMGLYIQTGETSHFERLARLPLDVSGWTDVHQWSPAFRVEVAGTTGAGDAAYAGFLAALLRGLSPAEAVRRACAVGACAVETADATGGIQTWDATSARLDAGWPQSTLHLRGASPLD